jgi:hypothetical protein
MSRERELLLLITKRFQEEFNNPEWYSEVDKEIIAEIDGLLAEPEPEPVFKEPSELALKIANEIADQFRVGFCDYRMVEFFAEAADKHLPKLKPLSDEEIIAKYKAIAVENALYVPTYYAGFRDAEKAHGIGVDNE